MREHRWPASCGYTREAGFAHSSPLKLVHRRDGLSAVPPVGERGLVATIRDLLRLLVAERDSATPQHLHDGTRAFLVRGNAPCMAG
jgi:hypothetical protein